ncbi:MAG: serine/threonine-protein kinase [Polyangiaceae bacterium]
MDFVPGALVAGRYRLRRMVGAGGMGEVWAGEDAKTGSRVAVKHLLPTAAKHHEVVVRFKREAYLLGKIQSEFVARVVDFFDDEAYGLVLVMEFIDGPSLAHVLEDRTLSVEESVELAADLLQALRDLHSAKVVHRDLKPGNIIMRPGPTGRPRAVVVDFGISRLLPDKGENEVTGITRANIALGTVEYMAPEQILNSRDVTPVTDLYAVGIILWRALKGHHAFGDRRGEELARAKLIEEAPPLETGRRDELAQGLSRIVARALKKKPSQRYPSAVDMLAEVEGLRRFLSKVPGRPSSWSSADGIDIEDSTTDSGETAVRRSPLLDVAPAPAPEPPKLERPAPRVISQPRPAAGAPAKAPPPPAPSNPDVRASAPPAPAPSNPGAVIPRGSLPSIPEAVAIGDAPETRPRLPVARGSLPSIPESGAPDAARGGSIPDDVPRNPRASMQSFSDIGPPPIPAPAPSQAPAPVSNPASAAIPSRLTVPKRDSDQRLGAAQRCLAARSRSRCSRRSQSVRPRGSCSRRTRCRRPRLPRGVRGVRARRRPRAFARRRRRRRPPPSPPPLRPRRPRARATLIRPRPKNAA